MQELWFQAKAEQSRLLPPVCPRCLAVGVRPLPVPVLGPATGPAATAYYCERCADDLERARTLQVARLAVSGLLGIGTATTAALILGGAQVGHQVMATVLAVALPLGLTAFSTTSDGPALYQIATDSTPPHWLARRREYLTEMTADVSTRPRPRTHLGWRHAVWPLVAAATWLLGLHWLGRAELRVIHGGGPADAIVLVDHRRRPSIGPTQSEHPHAARPVATLAGRRSLALVSETGQPLAEVTATLWPGRDYLLGTLPRGQCLFLESQEYGARGDARQLVALTGSGPLWELPVNVDAWFLPLRARPDLPTSGGLRTAVRLLACP